MQGTFDVTAISVEIGAAFRLGPHLWLGAAAGVLPVLAASVAVTHRSPSYPPLELLHAQLLLRFEVGTWLDLDAGVRLAAVDINPSFGGCEDDCAPSHVGLQLGPYFRVLLGWTHYKLGPQVELAFGRSSGGAIANQLLITPLYLRYEW